MHLDGQRVKQERGQGQGHVKITDRNKTQVDIPGTDSPGWNFSRGKGDKWDRRVKKEMGGQRKKERAYGERSGPSARLSE